MQANVVGQDVEKYREITKGEPDLIAELNSIATQIIHERSAGTPVSAFNATPLHSTSDIVCRQRLGSQDNAGDY